MKKFFIKVFGCQYNEWDGARLSFLLKNLGFNESEKEAADIIFIINCSVRKTAVDRALSWVKNLADKNRKIIVAGCILEADQKRFIEKGALLWNGTDINRLKNILCIEKVDSKIEDLFSKAQSVSNLLPIMKGCNNFCSYCAVPYTRGREVSRPVEQVLEDTRKIIEAGNREIWLLGQNVNSYEYGFASLLGEIDKIPGNFKVFFTSNHPKDMSDEIIKAIRNTKKIAKKIHLPLQSGSNKILKAMNRPYTKKQYVILVNKIKKMIPNVELTTDTIIGFPGETEADFQETVDLLKEVNYSQVFNNKYSPRCGTAAFKLGDPIPWSEKERRWRVLNDLCNRNS